MASRLNAEPRGPGSAARWKGDWRTSLARIDSLIMVALNAKRGICAVLMMMLVKAL